MENLNAIIDKELDRVEEMPSVFRIGYISMLCNVMASLGSGEGGELQWKKMARIVHAVLNDLNTTSAAERFLQLRYVAQLPVSLYVDKIDIIKLACINDMESNPIGAIYKIIEANVISYE